SNESNIVGYTSIGGQGLFFPLSVVSVPDEAVWPYVQQWHVDVQHQILRNTVATIAYVGSKGTHLTLTRDLNQLPAIPLSLNPYEPGEPIGGVNNLNDDCHTKTTPSGVPISGQAGVNLTLACGGRPDAFSPFLGFAPI